jgi:hypothetical protein
VCRPETSDAIGISEFPKTSTNSITPETGIPQTVARPRHRAHQNTPETTVDSAAGTESNRIPKEGQVENMAFVGEICVKTQLFVSTGPGQYQWEGLLSGRLPVLLFGVRSGVRSNPK